MLCNESKLIKSKLNIKDPTMQNKQYIPKNITQKII